MELIEIVMIDNCGFDERIFRSRLPKKCYEVQAFLLMYTPSFGTLHSHLIRQI